MITLSIIPLECITGKPRLPMKKISLEDFVMRVNQEYLYEVLKDGEVFRSFPARQNALAYLAAARELCPDHHWSFNIHVFSSEGKL